MRTFSKSIALLWLFLAVSALAGPKNKRPLSSEDSPESSHMTDEESQTRDNAGSYVKRNRLTESASSSDSSDPTAESREDAIYLAQMAQLFISMAEQRGMSVIPRDGMGNFVYDPSMQERVRTYFLDIIATGSDITGTVDPGTAMNVIGYFKVNSMGGYQKDLADAEQHFKRAIELGNGAALVNLGDLYFFSTNKFEEAFALFHKAMDQRHPKAPLKLAEMLITGKGIPIDVKQAITLLESSYDAAGKYMLGYLYETGHNGAPIDLEKALSNYEKGSFSGLDYAVAAYERLKSSVQTAESSTGRMN